MMWYLVKPGIGKGICMNILHLKYAVEVEKTRSINRAAENLFMAQPNLSRAIRELEESLGITIFRRTSKGITVTPQGEEFLQYAKKILAQIDEVEALYQNARTGKQSFSISVPRASYISSAFTEFSKKLDLTKPAELIYKETNSLRVINNILQADYKLGILRYQKPFEQHFKTELYEKGLASELIMEFSYVLVMSEKSPLAEKETIELPDLADYVEIAHADPFVPSLPQLDAKKAELSEFVDKRIFVFERGSQMELLSGNPNTFMWVSPIPAPSLERFGLVQRQCPSNQKVYRDMLIYRKGYRLTDLDRLFMEEVNRFKPV